jgi:very-short-patch-repair endonuclease
LIVEVDGEEHNAERDAKRDAFMRDMSLDVLRFSAEDARSDPEGVIETLINFIANKRASSCPLSISPFRGRS